MYLGMVLKPGPKPSGHSRFSQPTPSHVRSASESQPTFSHSKCPPPTKDGETPQGIEKVIANALQSQQTLKLRQKEFFSPSQEELSPKHKKAKGHKCKHATSQGPPQ